MLILHLRKKSDSMAQTLKQDAPSIYEKLVAAKNSIRQ